jgi:hypothetical protein
MYGMATLFVAKSLVLVQAPATTTHMLSISVLRTIGILNRLWYFAFFPYTVFFPWTELNIETRKVCSTWSRDVDANSIR